MSPIIKKPFIIGRYLGVFCTNVQATKRVDAFAQSLSPLGNGQVPRKKINKGKYAHIGRIYSLHPLFASHSLAVFRDEKEVHKYDKSNSSVV